MEFQRNIVPRLNYFSIVFYSNNITFIAAFALQVDVNISILVESTNIDYLS